MSDSASTPEPPQSPQWEWVVAQLKAMEARLAALERRVEGIEQRPKRPAIVPPPLPKEPATPGAFEGRFAEAVVGAARPAEPVATETQTAVAPRPALSVRSNLSLDSLETVIGKHWASWLGGGVLLLGVCFFLKYAWDQGWIRPTPAQRVALAVMLGLIVAGLGEWVFRKGYRVFAASLHATAVAILLAAWWGANVYFDPPVIGRTTAFIAVALCAAGGVLLALRVNVMTLALLSFAGGYLSPFILSSKQDKSLELLTYLGVVAVAGWTVSLLRARTAAVSELKRDPWTTHGGWLPLRWFIFIASAIWFAVWWNQVGEAHRTLAMVWVAGIYLGALVELFVSDRIIIKNLIARGLAPQTSAELGKSELAFPTLAEATIVPLSLLLTGAAFGAYWAILQDRPREDLGCIALALAGVQAAVAFLTPSRQLMWAALVQVIALVTLAAPLFFDEFTITLAWLALAVAVALVGWQLNLKTARAWALVLLVLAIWRVGLFDSNNAALRRVEFTIHGQPVTRWLLLAWGTAVMAHVIAWLKPSAGKWPAVETWSDACYQRKVALTSSVLPSFVLEYHTPLAQREVTERDLAGALIAGLGTAVFYCASELNWEGSMMTLLLIGWTAPILLLSSRGKQLGYGWHALWLTAGASLRWLLADNLLPLVDAWQSPALDQTLPLLNLRVLSFVLICAALVLLARQLKTIANMRWTIACWIALLCFALVNFETWRTIDWLANRGTPMRDVAIVKQVAMSVLWAVIGLGAVIVGFWREIAPLRYSALTLLAVTLSKILVVDMADVQRVWRILSFIAVGALLLSVSYVYHRHLRETREVVER